MRAPRLTQLEESIRRIPGVQAATVIGAEAPSEIHIVATSTRSPKQLVRDIQSLASAGFGFAIDHRIVSIVRLEDAAVTEEAPTPTGVAPQPTPATQEPPPATQQPAPVVQAPTPEPVAPAAEVTPPAAEVTPPPVAEAIPPSKATGTGAQAEARVIHMDDEDVRPGEPGEQPAGVSGPAGSLRPVLEQMIFGRKDGATWAKVALRWPDGTVTQGVSAAGEAREVRAWAAGAAFLKALEPYLSSRGGRLEIEQILLHKSGARELVLVRAMFSDKGALTPLAGSAIIHDDVATATVHALLHASNRKLIALSA